MAKTVEQIEKEPGKRGQRFVNQGMEGMTIREPETLVLDNFKFFALGYLHEWQAKDSGFVAGLCPSKERSERLSCLREAAAYYRVSRNFRIREEERFDGVLDSLDEIPGPMTHDDVDSAVTKLARGFETKYGTFAISAASKFLWLRYQSPVVIYDANAIKCLQKGGRVFGECDYPDYRKEWRRRFSAHDACIRSACEELKRVQDFLMRHEPLTELIASPWFHERVFDRFLWWNGARFAAGG